MALRLIAAPTVVARVAQSEAKICAGKEYVFLCGPRARYLSTWGSDHVERSPTPTTVNDIYEIRDAIRKFFKLKNMGPAKRFLGYEILRDRDNRQIYLSQEGFARKILMKYGWDSMNPVQTCHKVAVPRSHRIF